MKHSQIKKNSKKDINNMNLPKEYVDNSNTQELENDSRMVSPIDFYCSKSGCGYGNEEVEVV